MNKLFNKRLKNYNKKQNNYNIVIENIKNKKKKRLKILVKFIDKFINCFKRIR